MNVRFGSGLTVHRNGVNETPCGLTIRMNRRHPMNFVPAATHPITCRQCLKAEEEYNADLREYIGKLLTEIEAGEFPVDGAMWRLSGYLEEKLLNGK